jgi:acetyl-CoA acetyltransferase
MRHVWIVDVRTPIGSYAGPLSGVLPDDLAATVIRALVAVIRTRALP